MSISRHDGSAPTLDELLRMTDGRIGQTNHLSAEARAAAIFNLNTL